MAELRVGVVDVYVIHAPPRESWTVLALRRSHETRCAGAWESIHGGIEEGERPEEAAVREVREETGLEVERLYNVTVHSFYLHSTGTVQLAVVFAAFVGGRRVVLGPEHSEFEWLSIPDALERYVWPRERAALRDIVALLGRGDAGPVEDVLRVY